MFTCNTVVLNPPFPPPFLYKRVIFKFDCVRSECGCECVQCVVSPAVGAWPPCDVCCTCAGCCRCGVEPVEIAAEVLDAHALGEDSEPEEPDVEGY